MGGRHRTDAEGGFSSYDEYPRRRKAGKGRVLAPLAGAVGLAVLAGVGAYVIVTKDRVRGCGDDKITLHVTASPDIRPAIAAIAGRFDRSGVRVDGRCVTTVVQAADSSAVAAALSGAAGAGNAAKKQATNRAGAASDLWIPDSSLWVTRLKAEAKQAEQAGSPPLAASGSAARSPVVLTAPKSVVPALRSAFGQVGWGGLMTAANVTDPSGAAKKVRVLALDPTANAAGLSALLAGAGVARAAGSTDAQLAGVLRGLSQSAVKSPTAVFASMTERSAKAPIGIASEQSVWAFNEKNHPENPAVALYPDEGTINLDYPIIVTAKDDRVSRAAKAFARELSSASSRQTLHAHGFRTPDGKGGPALDADHGVSREAVKSLAMPDAATVTKLSQAWARLKLGARILSLTDISGTMAVKPAGSQLTRLQLVAQSGIEGLKLWPDSAELGTWSFSTNLNGKGVDWKQEIPIGPLSAKIDGITRREAIRRYLENLKALPTGDTGLNDTLAAAYDKMKAEYEPDKVNTILVFTDGVGNDDPEGGISNTEILRKLRAEYDKSQPISVIIIALGATDPAGRRQMQQIAAATEGAAFFPRTPLEIRKVFLEGISRRLCAPTCSQSGE